MSINMDSSNNNVKILIATWGNLFQWEETKYEVDIDGDLKSCDKTNSTTCCLVETYRPDLVLIFIPDTLLCRSSKEGKSIEDYGVKPKDRKSYEDALKKLYEDVDSRITSWKGCDFLNNPDKEHKNIIAIAPGNGVYKCFSKNKELTVMWSSRNLGIDPLSYYSSYLLLKSFIETIRYLDNIFANDKPVEIELLMDTSHGINYMPIALRRTIYVLARILSSYYNVNVKIIHFNSDPYVKGVKKLAIHKVLEENINPNKAVQRLVYSYLLEFKGLMPRGNLGKYKNLDEDLKRIKSLFKIIVSTIHYSMPLAHLYFYGEILDGTEYDVSDKSSFLNKLLDTFNEFARDMVYLVKINLVDNNEYIISRSVGVDYDSIKSALSSLAIARYSMFSYKLLGKKDYREGFSLKDLKKILDERLKGPLYHVADHEISQFERYIKDSSLKGEYRELIDKACTHRGKWEDAEKNCNNVIRVLIAHGGLSLRDIKVMWKNGELILAYKEECIENIKRLLKRSLKDTYKLIVSGREKTM